MQFNNLKWFGRLSVNSLFLSDMYILAQYRCDMLFLQMVLEMFLFFFFFVSFRFAEFRVGVAVGSLAFGGFDVLF